MSIAWVFPGQGSQKLGMADSLLVLPEAEQRFQFASELLGRDLFYIPLMCVMCVAIPFVLVTLAPRYITAAEVNLFFLLETILGPIWVWLVIKEQPSLETIIVGVVIILTIGTHSALALKKT